MDFPTDHMATDDEWMGWQTVVAEWQRTIGEDMNDSRFTPLVKAIEAWAELLVALRVTQSEDQRASARAEKLGGYLTSR